MLRYRIRFTPEIGSVQYGVPSAEAITADLGDGSAYCVSGCSIYCMDISNGIEELNSGTSSETGISIISAVLVGQMKYPIQSITSKRNGERGFLCCIDCRGNILILEKVESGEFLEPINARHSSACIEESWACIAISPSGRRFATLHGLSSTVNVFSIEDLPTLLQTLPIAGFPRSISWKGDDTLIIASNRQVYQYSIESGTCLSVTSINTNAISRICTTVSSDVVVAATYNDRGVFCLNGSLLKISKRWKAPIRSSIIGMTMEKVSNKELGGDAIVAYMCGDDNEVLLYNCSGKEERESTLKERHSINLRSRSRIIGLCLQGREEGSVLLIYGQGGDLDVIYHPCEHLLERRKRKRDDE